jgi:hypothetical protein
MKGKKKEVQKTAEDERGIQDEINKEETKMKECLKIEKPKERIR